VITDSTGQRLSLVSNTSGKAGDVTVASSVTDATSNASIGFTEAGTGGQDAGFSVDGINMTSSSNTVTTAIPGVTFQLLSADENTPVQVVVTNDNTDIESAVSTFVSAYNTVVKDLNTQEGNDSSGNPEPLYGNPNMSMMQEQLGNAINFVQSSGAVTSLTQLGVTASVSDDGTLTLDSSTLDSMLNSNFQDVVNFFQPGSTSSPSFGDNLTTTLNSLSNSGPNGLVYLAMQQNSTEEVDLNTSITNQNSIISAQQAQLTTTLNAANYTLQEIPSQLDEVNELYSAITGYNENPNG
jgi:flagellar hook-associated protein 2